MKRHGKLVGAVRIQLIHWSAHFELLWALLGNGDVPDSATTAYDLGR